MTRSYKNCLLLLDLQGLSSCSISSCSSSIARLLTAGSSCGALLRESRSEVYGAAQRARPADLPTSLVDDGGDAETVLGNFKLAGVDLDELAATLQREGADTFVKSWEDLLASIAEKSAKLRRTG